MDLLENVKSAKEYIRQKFDGKIDVAIILGTGLGSIVEKIENKITIKYTDVPGFPEATVKGHAGELIIGDLSNKKILVFNGRFHYYEGNPMEKVTFGVRVVKSLGINEIIITNAAGGMNPDFEAGDLMLITDHINMMGTNPLIGKNYEEFGPRFPDMSEAYNRKLINLAEAKAAELKFKIKKGIYVGISGPTYETPAELRMLRIIGADAVGMSTVPEVIVANHMGMNVLGISCITDMAIPDNLEPLDHIKVVETANKVKNKFISLVKSIILDL